MKLSKETLQILKENGYENLNEYLENLSEDTGADIETVYMVLELLCESELFYESELFDVLTSALGDM